MNRVSKTKRALKTSHHQRFSINFQINDEIKKGGWRKVITGERDIAVEKHFETIGDCYELHEDIVSRIVFQYRTFVGDNGKTEPRYLRGTDCLTGKRRRIDKASNASPVDLNFDDIEFKVRTQAGDTIEVDTSCDSAYMKNALVGVGEALRAKFYWVAPEVPIYLVMDANLFFRRLLSKICYRCSLFSYYIAYSTLYS